MNITIRQKTIVVFQAFISFLILFGVIFLASLTLAIGSYRVRPAFAIFGLAIGSVLYYVINDRKITSVVCSGVLAVFVAWCTSLSLGYRIPTLGTGPLILFLMSTLQVSPLLSREIESDKSKTSLVRWLSVSMNMKKICHLLIIISVICTLMAFGIARQKYIYREQPASQLTYDLGDVVPGAKGIKTNNNTYYFFLDLQNAKKMAEEKGKSYCIIPDIAANWVKDSQRNPLSSDWPHDWELGRTELLDRIIGDLEEKRGTIIVIVEKYEVRSLSEGFYYPSKEAAVVNYVRSNFDNIGETQYFELYE